MLKNGASTDLVGEQNHSFARTHVCIHKGTHVRATPIDFRALQRFLSLFFSFLLYIGPVAFSLRLNGAVDPI